MYLRITLWIVGPALILFWFKTLLRVRNGDLYIDIDKNTGFLALSILIAGWMVAITQSSAPSKPLLASHFLDFSKAIGDLELTLEQLTKEIGKGSNGSVDDEGIYRTVPTLDDSQHRALKMLIYEGKICFRNERYSLPKNS